LAKFDIELLGQKGIAEVIDLKVFVNEYPLLVFKNFDALKSYAKNCINQ